MTNLLLYVIIKIQKGETPLSECGSPIAVGGLARVQWTPPQNKKIKKVLTNSKEYVIISM